jgi:hypothetical protein
MQCPQCNTVLGEGARACATCGWSASRKTLWIVLGCIAGFFFLVCCGFGTWGFYKAKKGIEAIQEDVVPMQLTILNAQVANFAQKKGKAPATLEEAAAEALVGKNGEKIEINMQNGQKTSDMWGHAIRFTPNADRTFELRSPGKDGVYDNGDDVSRKGTMDDDVQGLIKEFEVQAKKVGEGFLRGMGIDPEKHRDKGAPPGGSGDAPAVGTQGGGGGK